MRENTMPEFQFLTAWWTALRAHHQQMAHHQQKAQHGQSGDERPNDAGDIVQYVVITAALALAAVAIVAIIVAKLTSKATGLQTE
jgi:hypothetical protein